MTKTATHASRISSHETEKIGHDGGGLKELVGEAKTTLSNVGAHSAENLKALKERVSDAIAGVKARVKTISKAARQQAIRADKTIRANPYKSMGIAAGAGVVAGLIIARRRSAR